MRNPPAPLFSERNRAAISNLFAAYFPKPARGIVADWKTIFAVGFSL